MNFYQKAKAWLEAKGYEYLGDEGGLIFYKKEKGGQVQAALEADIAAAMTERKG